MCLVFRRSWLWFLSGTKIFLCPMLVSCWSAQLLQEKSSQVTSIPWSNVTRSTESSHVFGHNVEFLISPSTITIVLSDLKLITWNYLQWCTVITAKHVFTETCLRVLPKIWSGGRITLSRQQKMLIQRRAVVLSEPRGGGPPFIGWSRSLSEKILKLGL